MDNTVAAAAVAVPFVIAFVAVFKSVFPQVPARFAPALAAIAGVGWTFFTSPIGSAGGAQDIAVAGVVAGLMAGGFYSGVVKPAVATFGPK